MAFRPPSLWRRMGQTKKARNIRDSAAGKMARHLHVPGLRQDGANGVRRDLIKSKKLGPRIAAELDLNTDEIAVLMGSNPTTKKVQAIFEEAQALKEKEQTEDIEFGWRGSRLPTQSSSQSLSQTLSPSPTQSSSQSLSQSASPSPSKPSTRERRRSVEERVDNNSENIGDNVDKETDGDKKRKRNHHLRHRKVVKGRNPYLTFRYQ